MKLEWTDVHGNQRVSETDPSVRAEELHHQVCARDQRVRFEVWQQNDLWAGYGYRHGVRVSTVVARTKLGLIVSARWRIGCRVPATFEWNAYAPMEDATAEQNGRD